MISMAQSDQRIAVTPERLDTDHWLLNCLNGTLDLKSGNLRPHSPDDLITKLAPTDFDPDATSPLWRGFIEKVTKGDPDLAGFIQRACGYATTGDVSEQCLFFLFGGGENGKTTLLEVAGDILGDYAVDIRSDLLIVKPSEDHPTAFTDLEGKRFVRTSETEDGKRLAESLVKSLTGGDTIKARKMRRDFYSFSPSFKFFVAANHKPIIRGTDHGIWRRMHLIPFTHNFADDPDKVLDCKATLAGERAGILAWFVR
jgi:putative DNA primase/helicase